MIDEAQLKHVVHLDSRSQRDVVLLVLATDNAVPKQPDTIRTIGERVGVRNIPKWNLPDILAKAGNLTAKVHDGWELTTPGATYVRELLASAKINLVVTNTSYSLRQHLPTITSNETRAFVEEAIVCYEAYQYRAAVVFAWVGAVSVLHKHTIDNCLATFNAEATRRDAKWRTAKTSDDLGRMKEHEFLDILDATSVLGKNVKQLLQNQLQLRNSCGHPNSVKIAENAVAAHIEVLVLNVFTQFS